MAAPPKVVVAQVEEPVELAPKTIKAMQPQKRQGRQQADSTQALDDEISLKTKGQRKVNLIWEYTQSAIAIGTVGTCMFVFVHQALTGEPAEFPATLSNMVFAVLAFYLARTNHQAIGGTGNKPSQPYEGR